MKSDSMEKFTDLVEKLVWPLTIVSLVLVAFSFLSPLLFTQNWSGISFKDTGPIGDTISGTMTPFIAIASTLVTFLAFYIQFVANSQQKAQILEQGRKSLVDSFESNFFSLLSYHITSVQQIEITYPGIQKPDTIYRGQNAIKHFNDKIKSTYKKLKEKSQASEAETLVFAYLLFYYGNDLIENEKLMFKYHSLIEKFPEVNSSNSPLPLLYASSGFGEYVSPYFRNIFQIYKYIDTSGSISESPEKIGELSKYDYGKIVRSNLTNIEQEFIYYNLLTSLGKAWSDNNYILRYKPIKNIMLHQIETYSPQEFIRQEMTRHNVNKSMSEFFEYYDDKI